MRAQLQLRRCGWFWQRGWAARLRIDPGSRSSPRVPPPHVGATIAELMLDRLMASGACQIVDGQWLEPEGQGRVALRCASLCVMALTLSAAPAVAQTRESPLNITAFAGVAMAPGPHPAIGVAVGLKPRPGPVSLEFEYSRSRSDPVAGVPAIVTFAGNVLVQPPRQRSRFQFYGTFGVGLYAPLRDPSRRRGGEFIKAANRILHATSAEARKSRSLAL